MLKYLNVVMSHCEEQNKTSDGQLITLFAGKMQHSA